MKSHRQIIYSSYVFIPTKIFMSPAKTSSASVSRNVYVVWATFVLPMRLCGRQDTFVHIRSYVRICEAKNHQAHAICAVTLFGNPQSRASLLSKSRSFCRIPVNVMHTKKRLAFNFSSSSFPPPQTQFCGSADRRLQTPCVLKGPSLTH